MLEYNFQAEDLINGKYNGMGCLNQSNSELINIQLAEEIQTMTKPLITESRPSYGTHDSYVDWFL